MVPNVCEGQFNRQLMFVAVTDKKRFCFFSPKLSDFNAEHSGQKHTAGQRDRRGGKKIPNFKTTGPTLTGLYICSVRMNYARRSATTGAPPPKTKNGGAFEKCDESIIFLPAAANWNGINMRKCSPCLISPSSTHWVEEWREGAEDWNGRLDLTGDDGRAEQQEEGYSLLFSIAAWI